MAGLAGPAGLGLTVGAFNVFGRRNQRIVGGTALWTRFSVASSEIQLKTRQRAAAGIPGEA